MANKVKIVQTAIFPDPKSEEKPIVLEPVKVEKKPVKKAKK